MFTNDHLNIMHILHFLQEPTTTKSRAYIVLAYAISGPMNIAPPD